MRFKRNYEIEHGLRQMDIVPLINLIFLLLIFFIITSNFVALPGITVDLPRALTSEVVKYDNMVIMVSSDNIIYISGKAQTMQELKNSCLLAAKRNRSVLIKADRRASLGNLVSIWDLCRNAGITQINIATNGQ